MPAARQRHPSRRRPSAQPPSSPPPTPLLLRSPQDLSVSDCDWPKVPGELLQLPLTRLHLRFADFASTDWWPADAGTLASTLEALELPGCQIGAVPEGLSQLAALTRLSLERNFVRSLPAALSALRRLQDLSCEGCASLQQLPRALAAALPLRSLNLMHSGVLRLPLGAGARVLAGCGGDTGGGSGAEEEEEEEPAPSHFLRHLTELRWGAPEWERGARLRPFAAGWAGPGAASSGPEAGRLPDLSPLAQARGLRRVQLACVPAGTEAQLAELRLLLPELERLQVNSALFWLG